MKHLRFLLVVLVCLFVTESFSQRRYDIHTSIGIFGGITQTDIISDQLDTSVKTGWYGGLMTAGDVPHKWYNLQYGLALTQNSFEVMTITPSLQDEAVPVNFIGAQLGMWLQIKLAKRYVTLDVGPVIQVNGKLTYDDMYDDNLIPSDTRVNMKTLSEINMFNVLPTVGITAGPLNFKVRALYQYGLLNSFSKMNGGEEAYNFKGNQSSLLLGAMLCF
jgi:hypothetical protein